MAQSSQLIAISNLIQEGLEDFMNYLLNRSPFQSTTTSLTIILFLSYLTFPPAGTSTITAALFAGIVIEVSEEIFLATNPPETVL